MLMWDGWVKSKPVMKWKWHKGWPTNLSGALDQVSGALRQPVKQTWCCGGREGTAEWRSDKTMLFCALIRRLVFPSVTRPWSSSFDTGCTFKPFEFRCFTPEKCRVLGQKQQPRVSTRVSGGGGGSILPVSRPLAYCNWIKYLSLTVKHSGIGVFSFVLDCSISRKWIQAIYQL